MRTPADRALLLARSHVSLLVGRLEREGNLSKANLRARAVDLMPSRSPPRHLARSLHARHLSGEAWRALVELCDAEYGRAIEKEIARRNS